MADEEPEIDPTRIRNGMIIVGIVSMVALVLAVAINDPAARLIFIGVFLVGVVQVWRIRRRFNSL